MEKKIRLGMLMDFYGPLLTPHRREILALYCDEDMSFQEIADQMGISRQGAHDAVSAAGRQLEMYEATLGLMQRYHDITQEIHLCRELLSRVKTDKDSRGALEEAMAALDRIKGIER